MVSRPEVYMNQPLVTNIQRYSIHDGDGIRTTVFFKGCTMACRWCHNPETQEFSAEPMRNGDRCGGCGRCAEVCPEHAISMENGVSVTDREACTRCGAVFLFCGTCRACCHAGIAIAMPTAQAMSTTNHLL